MVNKIIMESDCCGASEWIEGTGICGACKEHADWNYDDEEDNEIVKQDEKK